jgi:hypothetical protein
LGSAVLRVDGPFPAVYRSVRFNGEPWKTLCAILFGVAGRADAPSAERAQVESIRAIAEEAWRIELTTAAPMRQSMRVLRLGSTRIDWHRDGIAMTRPTLLTLARLGLVDRSKAPVPDSPATVAQIKEFNAVTDTTPACLWLVTEGNSCAQQVVAGRAYARFDLAGTATGLAMHPDEQERPEYPDGTSTRYHYSR